MHMNTMVDFASSRDHDRTSYHSIFVVMRLMAFLWNLVKGYFANSEKKKRIHSMTFASSFSSFFFRSTGERLSAALSLLSERWYSVHSLYA